VANPAVDAGFNARVLELANTMMNELEARYTRRELILRFPEIYGGHDPEWYLGDHRIHYPQVYNPFWWETNEPENDSPMDRHLARRRLEQSDTRVELAEEAKTEDGQDVAVKAEDADERKIKVEPDVYIKVENDD